jgi:hypothetical protein
MNSSFQQLFGRNYWHALGTPHNEKGRKKRPASTGNGASDGAKT